MQIINDSYPSGTTTAYKDIVARMTNDTFDIDAVHQSVNRVIAKCYKGLYQQQIASDDIHVYNYKMSNLTLVTRSLIDSNNTYRPIRYGLNIERSMVNYDKTLSARQTDQFNTLLTHEQISTLPNIFHHNYLVFIEGYLIETTEIIDTGTDVQLIIDITDFNHSDGIPVDNFNDWMTRDVDINVVFLPNYTYGNITLTKSTIETKYLRLLPLEIFGTNIVHANNFNKAVFFINTANSGKVILPMTLESAGYRIPSSINLPDTASITVMVFRHLSEIITASDSNPWFELDTDDYTTPVPTSSIIPLISSNNTITMEDISFSVYYPNIYKVSGIPLGETVKLAVFHNDVSGVEYTDELALYRDNVENYLEKYGNQTIPDIIKNYNPKEYFLEAKETGFVQSGLFPYKMLYDITKFENYTKTDYHLFIQYLYLKLKNKIRLYIYMNKLDLTKRVRANNGKEYIPYNNINHIFDEHYINDYVTFSENHYVFSISKSLYGEDRAFRLYLDNYFLTPADYKYNENEDWYIFYIPCSKVTANSVLEIEKYPVYSTLQTINYNSVPIKLSIPSTEKIIGSWTIRVYDSTTKGFVDRSNYDILINDDLLESEDGYIKISTTSRVLISKDFYIRITNASYMNKSLTVLINSVPELHLSKDDDGNVSTHMVVQNRMGMARNTLRIFKNGRLVPIDFLYTMTDDPDIYEAEYTTVISVESDDDSILALDILPVTFTREFQIIGEFNDHGYINTGTSLSLPFDLKWYDVYVNGIKLNKSNVEVISENKFIIQGINTRRNLQIFLRQDAYQYSTFNKWNETIEDKIFDIQYVQDAIMANKEILDDELSDIMDEYVENVIIKHLSFLDEVLKYIFINPNTMQLTAAIEQAYPEFFDEYSIMWLDCNTNPDAELTTIINSNVRYAIMRQGQYRYGFTPMWVGNHSDAKNGEYMCDPLTGLPGIKTTDGMVLVGAALNRLNEHKMNFENTMAINNIAGKSIYQLEFNENTTAKNVTMNVNILDDTSGISIADSNTYVKNFVVSIDMDVLRVGYNSVLEPSQYDPLIEVKYVTGSNTFTSIAALSKLNTLPILVGKKGVTINSIKVITSDDTPTETIKMILHSILVAF